MQCLSAPRSRRSARTFEVACSWEDNPCLYHVIGNNVIQRTCNDRAELCSTVRCWNGTLHERMANLTPRERPLANQEA
eukprot:4970734-Prymnesium_polylepis.2